LSLRNVGGRSHAKGRSASGGQSLWLYAWDCHALSADWRIGLAMTVVDIIFKFNFSFFNFSPKADQARADNFQ